MNKQDKTITSLCEQYTFIFTFNNFVKRKALYTLEVYNETGLIHTEDFKGTTLPNPQLFSMYLRKSNSFIEANNLDVELPPDPALSYYEQKKKEQESRIPKPAIKPNFDLIDYLSRNE